MFKVMKVFDCQKMPDIIKQAFFKHEANFPSNDCYVVWYFGELYDDPKDDQEINFLIVQKWLNENGVDPKEDVLIKHWW